MTSAAVRTGHILIVDDDPDIVEALSMILDSAGYRTTTACNGREALSRLREAARPCLILLDLMMPVMNAWDFRAEQTRDPTLATIPVLVMTGFRDIAKNPAVLGVEQVLEKPLNLDRLLSMVARFCEAMAPGEGRC